MSTAQKNPSGVEDNLVHCRLKIYPMNPKNTKPLALLGGVVLVGAVVVILVIQRPVSREPLAQDTSRPAPVQKKPIPAQPVSEAVTVQIKDKLVSINIATGTQTTQEKPFGDLTKLIGLPKAYSDKTRQLENTVALVSDDKTQAIVQSTLYDLTKEQSDFDGSFPTLETKEFICFQATSVCSGSDMLARADKAVGEDGPWVWWRYFDSKDGFFLGHPSGEGVGNTAPYYVFTIATGKLRQTAATYKNEDTQGGYWYVHNGALSPSRRWIALEELKEGGPHILHIYTPRAIEKPVRSIPIKGIGEADSSAAIESIAWFPNEGSLLIGTDDSFYTFDLTTGKTMLVYTDTTQNSSLMKWDRNIVRVSSGGRYAVFNDLFTIKNEKGEDANGDDIKAIDIFGGGIIKTILADPDASLPIEEMD